MLGHSDPTPPSSRRVMSPSGCHPVLPGAPQLDYGSLCRLHWALRLLGFRSTANIC